MSFPIADAALPLHPAAMREPIGTARKGQPLLGGVGLVVGIGGGLRLMRCDDYAAFDDKTHWRRRMRPKHLPYEDFSRGQREVGVAQQDSARSVFDE